MNLRTFLIAFFSILCGNNHLRSGLYAKTLSNHHPSGSANPVIFTSPTNTMPTSTLIPPGQCAVSLTVNPSPAILGSLITFSSNLNCSIIPPFEYSCCYYYWQDNIYDNVTVTDGLVDSTLSRIYNSNSVGAAKYLMEVTVCWQKLFLTSASQELQMSNCDFSVAVNTTIFELTTTLNGYLEFRQNRDFPGNPLVLMVETEASATFVPTDQRLESLTYHWSINDTTFFESNDSSILFIPSHTGLISVEIYIFDHVSRKNGTYKQFIECKDPILVAFIRGEEQLLVESNSTFNLIYSGSGPFTFCWTVEPSDSGGPSCLYDLTTIDHEPMGSTDFHVEIGRHSGKHRIIGNLTNDVSKMALKYEFMVLPKVNIRSGLLVAILIVGVFMSAVITFFAFRKHPERRQRLPVEVADFDFSAGIAADRRNSSVAIRASHIWRSRVIPQLLRIKDTLSPASKRREMYTPLGGSSIEEERTAPLNNSYPHSVHSDSQRNESIDSSSSEEHLLGSLQMRRMNSDPGTTL